MVVGTVMIYLFGVLQLSFVAKFSMNKALSVGVLPFLIGDALKILTAAFIVLKVRDRIRI
jgi:biotin transport system substrate-specific component